MCILRSSYVREVTSERCKGGIYFIMLSAAPRRLLLRFGDMIASRNCDKLVKPIIHTHEEIQA